MKSPNNNCFMQRIHAELKGKIERYQGTNNTTHLFIHTFILLECLANKNSQLDALQQSLDAIKFEKYSQKLSLTVSSANGCFYLFSEQLATVLEGARLDGNALGCQKSSHTSPVLAPDCRPSS
jgi:hypothetical protein